MLVAFAVSAQTPRSSQDYNNRGLDRQSKGDIDGSIEDYSKAISLGGPPQVREAAYNNRANARISKNDLDGAIADYGKAIEVAPGNFENYYNRGVALLNKTEYDAAIGQLVLRRMTLESITRAPRPVRQGKI